MTDTLSSSKTIQGRTGDWEIVMGLEIHAQVASKAKLFFENWAHLKYMADNLGRIATVLEVMDARVKSGFTVVA